MIALGAAVAVPVIMIFVAVITGDWDFFDRSHR